MKSEAKGNQSLGQVRMAGGKGCVRKGNMFWGVREMQKEENIFQDKPSRITPHPSINNITSKTWGRFF